MEKIMKCPVCGNDNRFIVRVMCQAGYTNAGGIKTMLKEDAEICENEHVKCFKCKHTAPLSAFIEE